MKEGSVSLNKQAEQDATQAQPPAAPDAINLIHKVIVHTLHKVEGKLELDPAEKELVIGETVQRLIDQLATLYANRTGKSHGRFENDLDLYPLSSFLKSYLKEEQEFFDATLGMSKILLREARKTATPGGHVFYAHFTRKNGNDSVDYLIVSILNDELGAALKEKQVVDALHLDVKGFRLAGRVNLTKWLGGSDKYLSFLKGKGQDKVSDFFKYFLGCNNSVEAAFETANLTKVLEAFVVTQQMNDSEKNEFLRKAYAICKGYAEKDSPFELESFSNELWPKDPGELAQAVMAHESTITDGFVPDKRSLNRLIKFSGKGSHWRIDFDRIALNNDILYDRKNKKLVIDNLPADLLERLEAEFEDEEAEFDAG